MSSDKEFGTPRYFRVQYEPYNKRNHNYTIIEWWWLQNILYMVIELTATNFPSSRKTIIASAVITARSVDAMGIEITLEKTSRTLINIWNVYFHIKKPSVQFIIKMFLFHNSIENWLVSQHTSISN